MRTNLYHVYGINAFDGKLHHWRIKAKDEDDARELFEATEDDSELQFIILAAKIGKMKEHKDKITAADVGE